MPTPARSWPRGLSRLRRPAIKAAPTSGARLRRAVLRRLDVGAGAHTRPELAGGPEVRADVGIGPRGLLRQAPPGKMLRRGGACPRPRPAKAAPTSGFRLRRAILRRLDVGAARPPPGGQWPGGAGRCRHRPLQRSAAAGTARQNVGAGACPHPRAAKRAAPTRCSVSSGLSLRRLMRVRWGIGPLQRSAAAGTARPKCSVGEGLVPARGRPQGPPLLPGFRRWRAILRCSKHVGPGAHTRPQAPPGKARVWRRCRARGCFYLQRR